MSDWYILDENDLPVRAPMVDAAKWLTLDRKRVASDMIGEVRISTVFLGLDHNWDFGAPVLWETMIFNGEHDSYQERYSSKQEAIRGHARAVALVKGSGGDEA